MEMIQTFPAMNGPFAAEDDESDNIAEYNVGKDIIYVTFGWSAAEVAYKAMLELAEKHGVGFFDVSNNNGDILFPENGKLNSIKKLTTSPDNSTKSTDSKPWWKFW